MRYFLKSWRVWAWPPQRLVLIVLTLGALATGGVTRFNLHDLSSTYAQANPELRRFMLYGPLSPVVAQVLNRVPSNGRILLDTEFDPALIAYGLYPRRVWQVSADEALQPLLMQRDCGAYQERRPESFDIDWVLQITPQNINRGGVLYRRSSRAGR